MRHVSEWRIITAAVSTNMPSFCFLRDPFRQPPVVFGCKYNQPSCWQMESRAETAVKVSVFNVFLLLSGSVNVIDILEGINKMGGLPLPDPRLRRYSMESLVMGVCARTPLHWDAHVRDHTLRKTCAIPHWLSVSSYMDPRFTLACVWLGFGPSVVRKMLFCQSVIGDSASITGFPDSRGSQRGIRLDGGGCSVIQSHDWPRRRLVDLHCRLLSAPVVSTASLDCSVQRQAPGHSCWWMWTKWSCSTVLLCLSQLILH